MFEKTAGNPFFTIQFITELEEEGLLVMEATDASWKWDVNRIRAKGYTDNVVDLMVGKLSRLPEGTKESLKRLACLGNSAEFELMQAAYDDSDEVMHDHLWEAVRAGLILRSENSYHFLHDRVQEAAYSMIPHALRAQSHLRIGRILVKTTSRERLEETIFDIVNQLNRAASLVTAQGEREQLAEFNLLAGKRAQASSAYVSALSYLTNGAALLTEDSWQHCRELFFALELARAHCEFATGFMAKAEERLRGLALRALTPGERAAVACLQVDLYEAIDRNGEAVTVGLAALRHLGIDIPDHPTAADAQLAYEGVRSRLGARSIEELIRLPLMGDPNSLAALDLLNRVAIPGHHFESIYLLAVVVCTAVSLGLERGHSDASCVAYAHLGYLAGPHFGQFEDGYRFGRLACDLVEQPGFQRFRARIFEVFGFSVTWSRHVRTGRDFLFRGFELASQIGEISYAGYACGQINTNLLMAGDPLAEAQKQAEQGLAFARKVGFRTGEGWVLSQLSLIRSLRGLTIRLGSFDEADFHEDDFERELCSDPVLKLPEFWYSIRKMQARYFAGEYVDALRAASQAQVVLWNFVFQLESVEYHFYNALCHAAVHDYSSIEDRKHHCGKLKEHLEKLDRWASHCPQNFANRAALVGAEVARIEGREIDAMRLYEQAIQSAREHGFVQNEGVAHEVAARFYESLGFKTIADTYFSNAKYCYARWGAHAKVQQIDRLYPHLAAVEDLRSSFVVNSSTQHLDVASVVKASQALSSEIVLPTLIERLMRIAIENAGADGGLLILPSGNEYLIHADARASGDQIKVTMRQESIDRTTCPESLVRYVIRTRESVILDDASKPGQFSADVYFRDRRSKSILCLPLIKQRELAGILLLENTLTSHAFTPARIAVLELLAAQAAISLENTRLYSDLKERESKVRRLVDSNIIGICIFNRDRRILEANDAFLNIVGYSRDDVISGHLSFANLTPPEWADADELRLAELLSTGMWKPTEKEFFRKDGSRVAVLAGGATFGGERQQGVAFVADLTEQRRAGEALRQAQTELAHVSRISILGEMTASIAHEVNQPLGSVANNANACLAILSNSAPQLEEVRQALEEIIEGADRASAVISRVRNLSKKTLHEHALINLNEVVTDVMSLVRHETATRQVVIKTEMTNDLPSIRGDRVQLQQVLLNLVVNGMDAMATTDVSKRTVVISGHRELQGNQTWCVISVQDAGIGIKPGEAERLFDAFYTTKSEGMGMGLAISRSIIEAHGGKLWADSKSGPGANFLFRLPAEPK